MHFDHKSIFLSLQFYNCFRLLFCCRKVSVQNGHSIMPSKTTVIQLHRRVYSNTVACTAHVSTGIHNHECSTPLTERTNPPQVTTWAQQSCSKTLAAVWCIYCDLCHDVEISLLCGHRALLSTPLRFIECSSWILFCCVFVHDCVMVMSLFSNSRSTFYWNSLSLLCLFVPLLWACLLQKVVDSIWRQHKLRKCVSNLKHLANVTM